MHDPTPPTSAAWPAIGAGVSLAVVATRPSPVLTVLALWSFTALTIFAVLFRYSLQKWRAGLKGWAHHLDGTHTCGLHPRTARQLDEREAARHLSRRHAATWDRLTAPGAVTQLTNRAQRRAAAKRYGKAAAANKRRAS
jgi:hypothetical protein